MKDTTTLQYKNIANKARKDFEGNFVEQKLLKKLYSEYNEVKNIDRFISDVERAKHKSAAFVLPSRGANKGSIPRCLHRDSMSGASSTNTSSACCEDPLL